MSCPKSAGNSLTVLEKNGVTPVFAVAPDTASPRMARIDMDQVLPHLPDEDAALVSAIIAKRGPNKGCLRTSRPADPKAVYLWRKIAWDLMWRENGHNPPSLPRKLAADLDAEAQVALKDRLDEVCQMVEKRMGQGRIAALPGEVDDDKTDTVILDITPAGAGLPAVITAEDPPAPFALINASRAWSELDSLPGIQEEIAKTVLRMDQLLDSDPSWSDADRHALRWMAAYYAAGMSRTGKPKDARTADAMGSWSRQLAFEEILRAGQAGDMSEQGTLYPLMSVLGYSPAAARDLGARRPMGNPHTPQWWANVLAYNESFARYLPMLRQAIGRNNSGAGWTRAFREMKALRQNTQVTSAEMTVDELWESLTKQPTAVLMCGLVGSGKTTLAANLIDQMPPRTTFMASLDNVVKGLAENGEYTYREFFDRPRLSRMANNRYVRQVMTWMQRAPQLVVFDRMHLDTFARMKTLDLLSQSVDYARRGGQAMPDYRRVAIVMLQTEARASRNSAKKISEELPDTLTVDSIARMEMPLFGEKIARKGENPRTYDAILYAVPTRRGNLAIRGIYTG